MAATELESDEEISSHPLLQKKSGSSSSSSRAKNKRKSHTKERGARRTASTASSTSASTTAAASADSSSPGNSRTLPLSLDVEKMCKTFGSSPDELLRLRQEQLWEKIGKEMSCHSSSNPRKTESGSSGPKDSVMRLLGLDVDSSELALRNEEDDGGSERVAWDWTSKSRYSDTDTHTSSGKIFNCEPLSSFSAPNTSGDKRKQYKSTRSAESCQNTAATQTPFFTVDGEEGNLASNVFGVPDFGSLDTTMTSSTNPFEDSFAKDLERRLSEEREISEKIKELNALIVQHDDEPLKTTKPLDLVEPKADDEEPLTVAADAVNDITKAIEPCTDEAPRRKKSHRRRSKRKSKKGSETSWVYLNAYEDFSDVRTRDRLMKGYNSSSSDEEPRRGVQNLDPRLRNHNQLHALHRIRRERKKGLVTDKDNMWVYSAHRFRASIVDRSEFFYRFGEKEKEACATFNFLDELSTSTPSSPEKRETILLADSHSTMSNTKAWSDEELSQQLAEVQRKLELKQKMLEASSDEENVAILRTMGAEKDEEAIKTEHLVLDNNWPQLHPLNPFINDLSDEHLTSMVGLGDEASSIFGCAIDHISLSDSCAESYYGTDSEKSFRSHENNSRE